MSVNFFDSGCKEPPRNDKCFGLCDDGDGTKAYSNDTDNAHWIAKVINENETEISFTAIDNCVTVLKNGTNDKESTCDGMLTSAQSLFLIELKTRRTGGWFAKAKAQLENTITLLVANHNLDEFRYKKAFACNNKHPYFTVIDAAEKKMFYKKNYGFRIDVQAEIVIK